MVSLRRRRLLGYSTGLLPHYIDDEGAAQFGTSPENQAAAHPTPYYFDEEAVAQFGTCPTTETKQEEIASSWTITDPLSMLASESLKVLENEFGYKSPKEQHDKLSPGQQANPIQKNTRKRSLEAEQSHDSEEDFADDEMEEEETSFGYTGEGGSSRKAYKRYPVKNKRPKRKEYWDGYVEFLDDKKLPRARCVYCGNTYACDSNMNGTKNVRNHFYRCRKNPANK